MTATVDRLFAAVHAAPDDDAVRAVLADRLQELGDPRGELIAIQLAHASGAMDRDTRKRVRTLLKEHGAAWSGPLAQLCKRIIFRGGFPSTIQIHPRRTEAWSRCAGDPVLATVEELGGHVKANLIGDIVRAPALRALRTLALDADPVLDALEDRAPTSLRAIRGVEWNGRGTPYRERWKARVIPLIPRLAGLIEITITAAVLEDVIASPAISRLERIAMWAYDARELPALLARLPTSVTSVWAQNITLVRTPAGLTCKVLTHASVLVATPVDAVRSMPRGTRIELAGPAAEAVGARLAQLKQKFVRVPDPPDPSSGAYDP